MYRYKWMSHNDGLAVDTGRMHNAAPHVLLHHRYYCTINQLDISPRDRVWYIQHTNRCSSYYNCSSMTSSLCQCNPGDIAWLELTLIDKLEGAENMFHFETNIAGNLHTTFGVTSNKFGVSQKLLVAGRFSFARRLAIVGALYPSYQRETILCHLYSLNEAITCNR